MIRIRNEEAVIVTKDGKYYLYNYESEIELERMVIEHSSEIFGKNTHYFNIKKKISSKAGFGTVPDGYVIDFEEKKLYIVEVELIRHDMRRHIRNQIVDFIQALDNEKTHGELIEIFREELPSLKNMGRKNLEFIVANRSIIILIDDIGDPMKEINPLLETINFLSKFAEVKAIPFQTYVKGSYSKDHVHSFKSFTKEELEKESKKWTFKWTTVDPEKHFNKLNDESKEIFKELSKKICCIAPDIKEVHRKNWTTYQISKLGNFCTVKFPKGCLEIHMKVNKEAFVDNRKLTKDIKRTPAWTFDKVFTINSRDDMEYALHLIKQAYECICRK
ncbi:MAG: DUF5655 domain-containing protein [Candidatus Aenigmatarchaeota archaeon]